MAIKAVIFDLDGVLVSTDEYHYRAWRRLATEEGIYFDGQINERLRGISRLESLEIVLERAKRVYSREEKALLAARKNEYYRRLLKNLGPQAILPGVARLLGELREEGLQLAVGSGSKNAPLILEKVGLRASFDAVIDGSQIKKGKPHPEIFLLAAQSLRVEPRRCVVIEDARAGIDAALAAGMRAVGVGFAAGYEKADYRAPSLEAVTLPGLLGN